MCGLLYATSFDGASVNDAILKRYKSQRLRGIEGFGIYDRSHHNLIKTPKEDKIINWLKKYKSSDLLFHHRLPTSTKNVKNACHPFSTGDFFKTNYIMIHNGWISNDDYLIDKHIKDFDIVYSSVQDDYTSFNDSESLLWDFALWKEGLIPHMQSAGAVAFICITDGPKNNKLYYYRNSHSPLFSTVNLKGIFLASEGEGERVPENVLFCYDYDNNFLTYSDLTLDSYSYSYRKDYNYSEQTKLLDPPKPDKEVGEETWENFYSYPLSKDAVYDLWPKEGDGATEDHHLKAVTRYMNQKLLNHRGVYEEVCEAMERDALRYENVLTKTATSGKARKKYRNKMEVCNIAVNVLLASPIWQVHNQEIDPYFEGL